MSVVSDAYVNNLETQRRVLADYEQVFKDVGRGAPWNRSLERDGVNGWARGGWLGYGMRIDEPSPVSRH